MILRVGKFAHGNPHMKDSLSQGDEQGVFEKSQAHSLLRDLTRWHFFSDTAMV